MSIIVQNKIIQPEPVSFWESFSVILNLAVFFAYHVLWPQGFEAPFEWFSALIGVTAFVALFRYKVGIVSVIGACAVLGLGYSLLL